MYSASSCYFVFFIFTLIAENVVDCVGLDFDDLEDLQTAFISSVAVHRSRAFLALPRSVCPNSEETPTLVETHWNGGEIVDIFSRFSQKFTRQRIMYSQKWGDCSCIQDAISLATDPSRPKLWVLDKGNEFCGPKVVSYNLIFNHLADKSELSSIDGNNLNTIVIDDYNQEVYGYRAYIGQAEENVLLVFSLKYLTWRKINLIQSSSSALPVKADFMAISKVSYELFITGRQDLEVFSIDLQYLRHLTVTHITKTKDEDMNVTLLGKKLGPSTAIESDLDSGLIYFMTRDYAIVRWNTGFPMQAEYHTVLAQSYESFPYISGYLIAPDNSIWAIVNAASPEKCINLKSLDRVENRVVKLISYYEPKEETKLQQL